MPLPLSLLLIDDHFVVRSGLVASLELEDDLKVVGEADRGEDASRLFAQTKPDVVLMDIQMPEFDGYQTITYLRQHGFNRPVIALSAHAMREDRERSLASGFNEHMSKPVNRQELLTRIAFLLKPFNSSSPSYETL
jgi:DNA-binding NarL/FixJ family response regulator